VYLDETAVVPKNATVLVKRVAAPRGSVGLLARLKANTPLTPHNMYVCLPDCCGCVTDGMCDSVYMCVLAWMDGRTGWRGERAAKGSRSSRRAGERAVGKRRKWEEEEQGLWAVGQTMPYWMGVQTTKEEPIQTVDGGGRAG
jgi:hypothetical protein